jgi:hypothetical protein
MTPIEDRILWSIHRAAADAAKARGCCFDCQQQAGFAATERAQGRAAIDPTCHLTRRREPHASQR